MRFLSYFFASMIFCLTRVEKNCRRIFSILVRKRVGLSIIFCTILFQYDIFRIWENEAFLVCVFQPKKVEKGTQMSKKKAGNKTEKLGKFAKEVRDSEIFPLKVIFF